MTPFVSPYSLAVRVCAVLMFFAAGVNAVLIFGFGLVPLEGMTPLSRVWWIALQLLNALLVVGVAFMAADAGLAAGPADGSARRRLLGLTEWLPVAGVVVVVLTLISPTIGRLIGDTNMTAGSSSLRSVVGQLIPLGWALFGWAAVLRWLKQGPGWALMVLTRLMEAMALTAMALDVMTALQVTASTPEAIYTAAMRALDAVAQGLAVVACVEAVLDPNPARLDGLLGQGLRVLVIVAWLVLVMEVGLQIWAFSLPFEVSPAGLLGPLTSVIAWCLAFSERQLLAATLWTRERRVTAPA